MSASAIESVRDALIEARGRGERFDLAWPRALPADPLDREVLLATRDAWLRAYVGAPAAPGETAAARLFGARLTEAEPVAGPFAGVMLG